MKLIEVFNQLTHGELSNLSIGGRENGEITEENYKGVMAHVNLGLTDLFKRFTLKEGRLQLELQDDQALYSLSSKFAVNGKRSKETVRYILDTVANPFRDDVLKIEQVITDAGCELELNNKSAQYSCFTPSAEVLRVPTIMVSGLLSIPEQLKTEQLTVVYRANHPVFDTEVGSFDPGNTEVELPYTHLWALCLFVASRINNPIGMSQEFNAGNNYAAKYEAECQRLEADGYEVDQGAGNSRARRNGWV